MKYRYKVGIDSIDIKLVELCRILSFEPQTIDEITEKMHKIFHGNDKDLLKSEIECAITGLVDNNIIEEIKSE